MVIHMLSSELNLLEEVLNFSRMFPKVSKALVGLTVAGFAGIAAGVGWAVRLESLEMKVEMEQKFQKQLIDSIKEEVAQSRYAYLEKRMDEQKDYFMSIISELKPKPTYEWLDQNHGIILELFQKKLDDVKREKEAEEDQQTPSGRSKK